jgi:hypothetical protein
MRSAQMDLPTEERRPSPGEPWICAASSPLPAASPAPAACPAPTPDEDEDEVVAMVMDAGEDITISVTPWSAAATKRAGRALPGADDDDTASFATHAVRRLCVPRWRPPQSARVMMEAAAEDASRTHPGGDCRRVCGSHFPDGGGGARGSRFLRRRRRQEDGWEGVGRLRPTTTWTATTWSSSACCCCA